MNIHKQRSVVARRTQSKSNQSRSFEERRKRRVIMSGIICAVGFFAWIFVFYRISASPSMALLEVHVSGADDNMKGHLEAAAYGALEGSYLGILSKANTLIYPKGAVAAAVQAAAASVGSVSVSRDGTNGLKISIKQKAPAAIACAGLPNFGDNGALASYDPSSCYFADESGYIFKEVATSAPASLNIYYVPNAPSDPIGSYATSTATFKALQAFVSGVRSAGISAQGVLIKPEGEYELYAQNPTKNGAASSTAIIYFNDQSAYADQLSDLSAFWAKMKGPFEYIDIRYGANVFYRLIQ